MAYSLTMTFLSAAGEKVNVAVNDVKSDLTQEQIVTCMNAIITNNVFTSKIGNNLTTKHSAQIVERNVTAYADLDD